MAILLIDANLDGHCELLVMRMQGSFWREVYEYLDLKFLHLEEAGLTRTAEDDEVWRHCQENGYYLFTANRNHASESSLEATIHREGTVDSLPVLTLADAERVYQSKEYLDEVIEALFEYLLDEANLRGTGRLYLP